MNSRPILIILAFVMLPSTMSFGQSWKSEIGFNDLVSEKGGSLGDGAGLNVMQAEAPDSAGNYMPDVTSGEFAGKTFTEGSGAFGANNHGTLVARNFYGNSSSMTGGISSITGYDANNYIFDWLNALSGNDLNSTPAFDIGNHSYVGNGLTTAQAEDILERFDFVINRDNTLMVVGANNGSTSATPQVLTPSYNAIAVGRSDGGHSQSLTSVYGAPRFATSIVVPSAGATSFSTPVVGSAAALLKHAGAGTDFVQNEVIRATLFAGATKDEFASWDRTSTRPMDEVFGFGELNILNSYHIFEGGQFEGSTTDPTSNISNQGWDYGDFDGSQDLFYDFSIASGGNASLSAVLSWNMDIVDVNSGIAFEAERNLADLNLELFDSSGSFLGTLVDASNGSAYNNEHIFFEGLDGGNYTFRISGNSATDFGFSWNIQSVPEPSSATLLGLGAIAIIARRRRR
ncbi:MAG: PEP-CTERM sorting domain-containing protein [Planctomycetaceae bacterium]|nr:PEP-CTERM sorting domain-containing protein [Planctomycetaceae bacterium]